MKLRMKVAVIFAMAISFAACKKYEDGPDISLVPRKDRVANTWVVEKAIADNKDVTEDYDQYELYLTRDGDAELTAKYDLFGRTFIVDTDGTWEFTNSEKNIRFDYEDNEQDAEYQILRLTEKEFWLRKVGAEVELHLRQK